jgi:hypothetical protein
MSSFEDDLKHAWDRVRGDIERQLAEGILISKGIAIPHIPSKDETEIPPHEWRIMIINPVDETAVGKSDGEVKYIGVLIGRRSQS